MTSTEQREQLREEWRERVATFRASGQNVSAWCAAQGIKPHQLRYWLPRLAPARPAESTSPQWLPVALREERGQEPPASRTGLAVRVGPAVVEVQPGFDRMLLTAVVRALMELC